ncbi:hypothetical protein BGZ46_000148 [Entomortierella lignicola]|nr:hypothetical protein BGZ46_000148 [Entomortierella lignicola]
MAANTSVTNTTSSKGAETMSAAGGNVADATQLNGTSTAAAPPNNSNTINTSTEVWSSLLKSVASSRLVPSKDVIILGDPHSGKSTLIELLKTALPTPPLDANANGVDGSKAVNGIVPTGANGVANTGNGSAPVMVEMGTGTSEDNMFADGNKKNDLALSYSFWNVDDDENEDTVARLGLYQIAGSHKSYHALLKYCLNTKTIADSVVIIVLDWSKPWTFMETLQRWIRVLEGAIQQICQEGAVGTATWTKGKALMDELQEKLSRFLQEYTEPQSNSALGGSAFGESQAFNLGSTDAQSVLLPLTEGCLTSNTGVPIVVVCTKSDHINNLEREQDYKEETFDYIQQSLRTICLKYGASLFYTSIHHPHTFADLRQYLLHRLLTPSTLNNPQQQPSSFPFRLRAQVVERDQVMVPAGWDSFGKIKVLRNGFDCEDVATGWELDLRGDGAEPTGSGARQVYEEVIINPKLSHAPEAIQPLITAEDDQVFLESFFGTLQRANERPSGASTLSNGLGGASGPPVVGPLGSGYNSMINSHHSSPPPSMSAAQTIGSAGARSGVNGNDPEDIEGRLKRLTSKTKANGGSQSGLIGPSVTEGGLSSNTAKFMKVVDHNRSSASPPISTASSLGGMAGPGMSRADVSGAAGTIGGASAAASQTESTAIQHFFQSLMTRKGPASASVGASPSAAASASGSGGASGSNDA